jgi:dTDP-glucose 4,6-dehydratase
MAVEPRAGPASSASFAGAGGGHDGTTVEMLLGRPIVEVATAAYAGYLAETTVLVTGAGGTIGAELCARLLPLGIRKLVLVDHAEAPLVELARALRHDCAFPDAVPVLADIKSRTRMFELFEAQRPDVVFHAAAYKHVPLLEESPVEGVATNVLGTKCIVDAARHVGVRRFVLFSTDKAVAPTNVLGRTKGVAEWIVAAAGREVAGARYSSVRLGNVFDSTGSILPFFRSQLARGEPLTVTHPEATRYLVTAGEAAGLAIVTGALGDPDGVFWLDVGRPVSVLDLARRVAAAAQHDLDIEFVGLRSGERLHERLFSDADEVAPTSCEHVRRSKLDDVDGAWLNGWLAVLARHVRRASAPGVRAALADMHARTDGEAVQPAVALAR